jgi:DNA (cytosine-5)-methyltransferase 1
MIVDAFAGPGGWDQGARIAGYTGPLLGIELDMDACRTAVAAGHPRVRADVATFPLTRMAGRVDGVILSPPCPTWSAAGDGAGKVDLANVLRLIADYAAGREPGAYEWVDARSALTAQPMRWAHALRPRFIVLEQVPPVLVIWRFIADQLRNLGYRVWTGILSSEEFGVPQTRKRAVLIGRLDAPALPPIPTHQAYRSGVAAQLEDDLFGSPLPLPVSMATALGWDATGLRMAPAGVTSTMVDPRDATDPAHTLTGKGTAAWVLRSNYGTGGDPQDRGERAPGQPSPTVTSKIDRAKWVGPGDMRRVSVEEAGVMQSFPADYPWYGTSTKRYLQVGNAVPPLLAAAILRPLLADAGRVAA